MVKVPETVYKCVEVKCITEDNPRYVSNLGIIEAIRVIYTRQLAFSSNYKDDIIL